jgi:hypothetical protein
MVEGVLTREDGADRGGMGKGAMSKGFEVTAAI